MPAITPRLMADITASLGDLARIYHGCTPLILTGDEFVDAFIDPEHVPKLLEVQALVGTVGSANGVTSLPTPSPAGSMRYSYAFSGRPPVILPQYIKGGLQPTCSDRTRMKIEAWTADRYRTGLAFGTVLAGLEYLNDRVVDTRAMAIMIPCLPAIMAKVSSNEDNHIVKRAQRLSQNKKVPKLPRLDPEQREVLRDASALVAMVALMESPTPELIPGGKCAFTKYPQGEVLPKSVFGNPSFM